MCVTSIAEQTSKNALVITIIESPIFNTKNLFFYNFHLTLGVFGEIFGGFQGTWAMYIKILMMQICSAIQFFDLSLIQNTDTTEKIRLLGLIGP